MNVVYEREGASIVVIGNFNPAIFHPLWFDNCQLIAAEEAEVAKEVIVTDDFTSFTLPWCRVQVFADRFCVETTDSAKIIPLQDLVAGTFAMLEHCPIKAFGLNRHFHVQLDSNEKWHALGHLLAPKTVWEEVIDSPGTRSVSIWGERSVVGSTQTRLQARFEPSTKLKDGVFFELNRHYNIEAKPTESLATENLSENPPQSAATDGTSVLLETLADSWKEFLKESESVVSHVLKKANELIAKND